MRITRDEFIAGMQAVTSVQSATWKRRVDKKNKSGVVVAEAGDIVSMQFIPRINPNGTKNWRPVGGQCFGVATRTEADAIKRRKGLVGVLKMSETDTNDTRGVPRTIPVYDVETWKAEGIEYEIVD